LPGFELPEQVLISLHEYDSRSAALLDDVADWIEGTARPGQIPRDSLKEMEQSLPSHAVGQPLAHGPSFVTLLRRIDKHHQFCGRRNRKELAGAAWLSTVALAE